MRNDVALETVDDARPDATCWWPAYAPDEILPGLFQGGTEDDEVIGFPASSQHYRFTFPFDMVVTLYADAQPAPWGVEELRFGFGDADLSPKAAARVLDLAAVAFQRWQNGDRVLIRCQAGVNRSGLVTALILMMHGLTAQDAISLIRRRRGAAC